jgi:hypothetical protein
MMMKRYSMTVAALLLAATTGMNAAVDLRCHAGSCITNRGWYSLSSYENGRLVRLRGHDAFDRDYEMEADARTVANDPTGGEKPIFSGVTAGGVRWFVVVRYDAGRRVIWQGGRDGSGAYWEWTAPSDGDTPRATDPDLR